MSQAYDSVLYTSFEGGEEAPDLRIADFILTHRTAFVSRAISFGQSLRYRGSYRQYAFWNHAAFVASSQGDLIEALTTGVARSHISKYKDVEYTVVRIAGMADIDRSQCLEFAQWCVGQQYGWITIVNVALWSLFGGKFDFSMDGQEICSGLIARSLERAGEIFSSNPSRLPPAGLAQHFNVSVHGQKSKA